MNLAEKIKVLRNKNNLTQQQLAKRVGVQRNSITQYEAGRIIPPAQNLSKLAHIFSVSVDFLLDEEANFEASDIPSVMKSSLGNSYIDSILSMTAKKLTEDFVKGRVEKYIKDNKDAIYKLIETVLYLNVQAKRNKEKVISIIIEADEEKEEKLNNSIVEFAKQINKINKLQQLMDKNE